MVACGGNPQVLSAFAHIGNLIPHSTDRVDYGSHGNAHTNSTTGIQERVVIGAPKAWWPIREDTKLMLRDIYDDLQVDSKRDKPFMWVRYPIEDGKAKTELQVQRMHWLIDSLKHTRKDAKELAEKEMAQFLNSDKEALNEQDPLGSLTQVNKLIF